MMVPSRRKWTAFRTCLASVIFILAFFRQQRGLSAFLVTNGVTTTNGVILGIDPWSLLDMGTRLLCDHGSIAQNTTIQDDDAGDSEPQPRRVIYSRLRKDQAGWVVYDMLKAHSYAFAMNMTYGGACGESIHKQDIYNVLVSIGWDAILPMDCPTNNATQSSPRVYPGSFFERDHGNRMASRKWRDFMINHTDYSYFDHPRRGNNKHGGSQEEEEDLAEKPISIVVHIRRRDVTPCCYPHWYLPNSYFASMMEKLYTEQVQRKNKNSLSRPIQIQIFSQSESHESWEDLNDRMMAILPHPLNYTLHLDGPVGEVWRAIVSSDVFLGSISEFSRVPAMFARGLVVDPHNISDGRIALETKQETQRLLDECGETKIVQCKHKWWLKGK